MKMKRQNKSCRCCGFEKFNYLAPKMVSNFFLNNGLHISSKVNIRGAKFLERYLPKIILNLFYSIFYKILNIQTEIEYGYCANCNFIGPWPEISDDSLSDFYKIYGNKDYKKLRSIYEPWYKNIAELHLSEYEFEMRRKQHDNYILPILNSFKQGTLNFLDYGGGRG